MTGRKKMTKKLKEKKKFLQAVVNQYVEENEKIWQTGQKKSSKIKREIIG